MTYLLTPEEIHNARYDQIVACMNVEEIAQDWCRRQAVKIVETMGPYVHHVIEDENTTFRDGNALVDPLGLGVLAHYWAELENAVGVFRSPQVNVAGKGCPGLSLDGTCDATEAPCVPGSRTGCFAGATHTCYYCDHEGTEVNRIGGLPGGPARDTQYCCDDGDACDARIRG